jgi:hypothetical protein
MVCVREREALSIIAIMRVGKKEERKERERGERDRERRGGERKKNTFSCFFALLPVLLLPPRMIPFFKQTHVHAHTHTHTNTRTHTQRRAMLISVSDLLRYEILQTDYTSETKEKQLKTVDIFF